MLRKGIRLPSCGKGRNTCATPRLGTPTSGPAVTAPAMAARSPRPRRSAFPAPAVAFEAVPAAAAGDAEDLTTAPRVSPLRLTAEAETAAAVPTLTTRFVVPHFVTKPGQQLFLSGSTPELGEWDPQAAVPMEWREGHQHVAVVRLPASRVVQVKLGLKENGRPLLTEEGDPRDIMLMPANLGGGGGSGGAGADGRDPQQTQRQEAEAGEQQEEPGVAAASSDVATRPATAAASVGPRLDYQIMCHFGNMEATPILKLPVVLPAKESGDRRVLCKFVVMLGGLKLEPRQYPVVVGSAPELGAWRAEEGVKLMRQVGGYWTRRVELQLHEGPIQAKVVICNADGQAAQWEPGTANRMLAPSEAGSGSADGGGARMHIYVCRWGQPDQTAVVSVPVEYERADKEFVKQLDAAQREIGIMRRAVTAKSRQCQSLESELAASRRAERALREEVTGLRSEVAYLMQDVEVAQRSELEARQEAAALQQELQAAGEAYEGQISFLESKLDEMEAELTALQQRLVEAGSGGSRAPQANGHSHHHEREREEAPRVMTRSSWR